MLTSEARLRIVGSLWSHRYGRLTLEPLSEELQRVQYRGHTVNSGDNLQLSKRAFHAVLGSTSDP